MKTIKFFLGSKIAFQYIWFVELLWEVLGVNEPEHLVKEYSALMDKGETITLNPFSFYFKDGYLYANNKNSSKDTISEVLLDNALDICGEWLSAYEDWQLNAYESQF